MIRVNASGSVRMDLSRHRVVLYVRVLRLIMIQVLPVFVIINMVMRNMVLADQVVVRKDLAGLDDVMIGPFK